MCIRDSLHTNIGQRLRAVEKYLEGEEVFMANYSDGLTDLNLDHYTDFFCRQDKVASFLSVRPSQSFHHVEYRDDGLVSRIEAIDRGNFWINGGFFILRKDIFDYIQDDEELVVEPFHRLIAEKQLVTYRNPGFWACMDTLRDMEYLNRLWDNGMARWKIWK